eukprot:scaffold8833_cov58-Phaeocystis_antarctica.AAC.8
MPADWRGWPGLGTTLSLVWRWRGVLPGEWADASGRLLSTGCARLHLTRHAEVFAEVTDDPATDSTATQGLDRSTLQPVPCGSLALPLSERRGAASSFYGPWRAHADANRRVSSSPRVDRDDLAAVLVEGRLAESDLAHQAEWRERSVLGRSHAHAHGGRPGSGQASAGPGEQRRDRGGQEHQHREQQRPMHL